MKVKGKEWMIEMMGIGVQVHIAFVDINKREKREMVPGTSETSS